MPTDPPAFPEVPYPIDTGIYADELTPPTSIREPGVRGFPTLDELWHLVDYRPLFYVGVATACGYTRTAWRSIAPPDRIRPFIPPRPVPPYVLGVPQGNAGIFEGQSAPSF